MEHNACHRKECIHHHRGYCMAHKIRYLDCSLKKEKPKEEK